MYTIYKQMKGNGGMKFTKMHGCGNDYIYVNCFEEKVENPEKLSQFVSDVHFGIGSDGLVLIMPSDVADCRMRMFNPDGSESEMCGNATRCVGKFVYDKGIVKKDAITLETLAGIKVIKIKSASDGKAELLTVDMGEPILKPCDIPVLYDGDGPVKNLKLKALDKEFIFTCVSMGNPHAVTFVEDIEKFDVGKYGKILEVDKHFPRKANIEFVEIVDNKHLKMRVWERGTGETWACGTGTCATVVASFLNGKCEREDVEVELLGGTLTIKWDTIDNHVFMTGPATFVCDGELY